MLVRQGALRTEHVCGRKAGGDVLLVGGGLCVYVLLHLEGPDMF